MPQHRYRYFINNIAGLIVGSSTEYLSIVRVQGYFSVIHFLISNIPVKVYIKEARGVFNQIIRGGILKSLYLLILVFILFISYILRCKYLVSFINLIVVLTILISSFQYVIRLLILLSLSYLLKQPFNIYNRSPNQSLYYFFSLIFCCAHLL